VRVGLGEVKKPEFNIVEIVTKGVTALGIGGDVK
jgi:hypothetical protein